MDLVAAAFTTLTTVFVMGLFAAGVMKLFQIHSTLLEIKDALGRRPVSPVLPAPSGEEMLRALDAQMRWEEASERPPGVDQPR
jgi:hypothetical protein